MDKDLEALKDKYRQFVSPEHKASQAVRVDVEVLDTVEIIKAYYSTDFAKPKTTQIVKKCIELHIEELKEKDLLAIQAITELLNEKRSSGLQSSNIFGKQ